MKWNLTTLFKTDEDFKIAFDEVSSYIPKLASFKGKLHEEKEFVEYLLLNDELEVLGGRVYQYCSLRSDLNKKNVENLAELSKVYSLFMQLGTATSFDSPEMLSIGKETIMGFIDRHPEIESHRFGMEKLFRNQDHVLDNASEKLLSYFSSSSRVGSSLYSALANGDRDSVDVKLKDKSVIKVNTANFTMYLETLKEPSDRKKVFEAVYKHFNDHKNTFAGIYEAVLNSGKAYSKARNYDSILESHLYGNNIPTSVYHNLVNVASKHNKSLKKYLKLRKKYLGLKQYHTYDRFLNLASSDASYTYDEAREIFFKSISHLPEDFVEYAHEAIKDGYVDVYPQDGKRTGAYSSGVTDTHPFILLNYTNGLDDVFTLAHEAGHSIHTLYAMNNQEGINQNYTIFVAEIASTFNEHNLLDYFIKSGDASKEVKIQLIQKAIDSIIGTFYRQTLFAHYELLAHEAVEKDQPINYQVLSNIMIDLYKQYYGLDITKEGYKEYVWAYIPHLFNSPFYVYQYATSFAASFKLYQDVKNNVPGAFDRYTGLLKSGGSKYPIEQAKEAGVDFTKKETFMAVINRMDELVSELEKLLEE